MGQTHSILHPEQEYSHSDIYQDINNPNEVAAALIDWRLSAFKWCELCASALLSARPSMAGQCLWGTREDSSWYSGSQINKPKKNPLIYNRTVLNSFLSHLLISLFIL